MKTEVLNRDAVETNTASSNNFTIKANGKAFKVLIDGLYADKIQSVTREIWSNALDSHIMAGKEDVPFEVSFPNVFDPTFRVRDFGVGLSHNSVLNLYTTMFESTKEDTNSQVGKFGIGSKSPFAYTDTFSIASVYNGHKNYYSAVLNVDGIPAIHHMHYEIVDEINGVEVSFPVRKEDVIAFQNAAQKVSLGFDVKPIVVSNKDFQWETNVEALYGAGIYVKMGCVIYPVDYNLIITEMQKEQYEAYRVPSEFIKNLSNTITVFNVPVGMVEISASRENLSYGRNDPTINTLMNLFKQKFSDIDEMIRVSYDSFQSELHCYRYVHAAATTDVYYNRDYTKTVINDINPSLLEHDMFNNGSHTIENLHYWSKCLYANYYKYEGKNAPMWRGTPVKKTFRIKTGNIGIFSTSITNSDMKKYPATGPSPYINMAQGSHKNKMIFCVVDRGRDTIIKKTEVYKKNRIIREKLNVLYRNSLSKDETIILLEYHNPRDFVQFMYELDNYVEGVDYELVDILNSDIVKIEIVKEERQLLSTLQKINRTNFSVCRHVNGSFIRNYSPRLADVDAENYERNKKNMEEDNIFLSENPDMEYILVESSAFKHSYLGMNSSGYFDDRHNLVSYVKNMPIVVAAPSNIKAVQNHFKNYIMAEELDLNDVLEYAITLEQKRIKSGQGTVYVPKFKVRQNTSTTSTFLSDLVYFSEESVWSKYSETYREYSKKFDENTFTQTDSDRLSGFGYICNFKKGFREKLKESCQSDNTLELYVERIKKFEEEIADAYPMLSHVGMNNIKSDRINDIVVYVKTMDRMRNI